MNWRPEILVLLFFVTRTFASGHTPAQVCVQDGSDVRVSCDAPRTHGHTCVWTDTSGMEYTMEDIRAGKVAGVTAAGDGSCDVTVKPVTDAWRTVNCSAVHGNDTTLLATVNINVVTPPELLATSTPATPGAAEPEGSTVLVSTAHPTSVECSVPEAGVAIAWMLGAHNITQHATISQQDSTTSSLLHHKFLPHDDKRKLRCCRSACRKLFCAAAKIRTMHKAQGFFSEYPKGNGVVVRFRSNPAPATLTWGLAPTCDGPPVPLDPSTDGNVTTTLLNHTDGWFSAKLVVAPANSSMTEEKLLLTVTQSEGNSTHCTTYYQTGLSSGAIVGISVAAITTTVLVSLALFIYYRSRGENYQA